MSLSASVAARYGRLDTMNSEMLENFLSVIPQGFCGGLLYGLRIDRSVEAVQASRVLILVKRWEKSANCIVLKKYGVNSKSN